MNAKKIVALLLALALCLALLAACGGTADDTQTPAEPQASDVLLEPTPDATPDAQPSEDVQDDAPSADPEVPVQTYNDVPLLTMTLSKGDDGYYEEAYTVSQHNLRVVRELPTAYEATSWAEYKKAAGRLAYMDPEDLSGQEKYLDACLAAQEALVQIRPYADCAWFIWGDDMPSVEDPSTYVYTADSWDYEGFKPYLVPYLLEDQSAVKGNLIITAGGGYSQRSNSGEGYPVAAAFNALGYNCFVLQRRVEPSAPADCWMDLQRSVRYIRYYAEELGLGGANCILATGFSGGAGTTSGMIANLYGDIQPTVYDSSYVPDAIDAVNSDLDVAFLNYGNVYDLSKLDTGTFDGWHTDNPNLPALFIAAGYADSVVDPSCAIILANEMQDRTLVELHVFANATHGYATGQENNNSIYWAEMADHFVDQVLKAKAAG